MFTLHQGVYGIHFSTSWKENGEVMSGKRWRKASWRLCLRPHCRCCPGKPRQQQRQPINKYDDLLQPRSNNINLISLTRTSTTCNLCVRLWLQHLRRGTLTADHRADTQRTPGRRRAFKPVNTLYSPQKSATSSQRESVTAWIEQQAVLDLNDMVRERSPSRTSSGRHLSPQKREPPRQPLAKYVTCRTDSLPPVQWQQPTNTRVRTAYLQRCSPPAKRRRDQRPTATILRRRTPMSSSASRAR